MLYAVNEFLIESDLALPCSDDAATASARAGRSAIILRHTPGSPHTFPRIHWAGRRAGTPLRSYDVGSGLLISVNGRVLIHIDKSGSEVRMDFNGEDPEALGLATACAVNLVLSACALLQGRLPLHGAAVDLDGRRVAILAPSGSGKSTLLWALLDQGAHLANDDVIPVRNGAGEPVAVSSGDLHAKLSRGALDRRGWDAATYQPLFPTADEFWVPLAPEQRAVEERPLSAIFVLNPHNRSSSSLGVGALRMPRGAAITRLMENTQGLWAAGGLVDAPRLLRAYGALADAVPLFVLGYEKRFENLPALVQAVGHLAATSGMA